jgi:hypothetical protein
MLQKQTRFWRRNCVFSDAILPFCVPKMKKITLKTKVSWFIDFDLTSPFWQASYSSEKKHFSVCYLTKNPKKLCLFAANKRQCGGSAWSEFGWVRSVFSCKNTTIHN